LSDLLEAHQDWPQLLAALEEEEKQLALGAGDKAIEAQHKKGRLTARERISLLVDPEENAFFELSGYAGYGMYQEWGGAPGGGVVVGLGTVHGRTFMLIANDATVKAGSFFPITAKKVLRAQRIAMENRLPLIYLVDSAGVFLPLQDEVFPDTDDFGRIFRNNARLSAMGVPQLAAIMGSCVAGGAYLPVMCDKILMTEGSGLYIAGPSLVKAAIGQDLSSDETGGAQLHSSLSGTIDFREPNDEACLQRLRRLALDIAPAPSVRAPVAESLPPTEDPHKVYDLMPLGQAEYSTRSILETFIDGSGIEEYKAEYGKTLICGYARIDGRAVGIVSNEKTHVREPGKPFEVGGVIYRESADKAARFIMDCNQNRIPLVFLQDVNGFMVGRQAEISGIIKSGAKMVNAVANSIVPKITVIMGGSYGAGNYALCGKAYDPRFIFAWPTCRYAVMGAEQAARTLADLRIRQLSKAGQQIGEEEKEEILESIRSKYTNQTDVRYAAARLWIDKIIRPHETRQALIRALEIAYHEEPPQGFRTGVLQT